MDDDQYSDKEAAQRREAALKRMFSTPPKRHKPIGKKPKSPERKRVSGKPRSA